jgi:tRNA(Ile)-lysidine synthase
LLGLARSGETTPVLCAVSGGLDSMCLLHLLCTWGAQHGFSAAAAHFNHRLRGADADRDEAFVRAYCAERGIPFASGGGDTRALAEREHLSVEEAARNLRYAFLVRTLRERGCAYLLTAHHADDNAETMLLNLCRGTGTAGLAGIPAERGRIRRPFLEVPRAELEAYAAENGIPHVEDATNASDDAARNVLRHRVLPVLKTLNPRAVEHMARTASVLAREDAVVEDCARTLLATARFAPGRASLPLRALQSAPRAVAERAVLSLMGRVCGRRRDLGFAHVEAVLGLTRAGQRGREAFLPYGMRARNTGEALLLERVPAAPGAVSIAPGRTVRFGGWTVSLTEEPTSAGYALNVSALDGPLSVTAWRASDRLCLPGSRGARSLKRLCADAGMTSAQRDALPVLRAGERPAAVPGIGVNGRYAPLPGGKTAHVRFQDQNAEENGHGK